ncbi:MAG: hypothetical protein GXX99_03815, partial [Clostridiales bacterium]|nr:hypothetical protein [Clostridiales bacterium]
SFLEAHPNLRGVLSVDKLIYSGFDTEEHLIFSVVTEDGTEIDNDMVNRIMELPAKIIGEAGVDAFELYALRQANTWIVESDVDFSRTSLLAPIYQDFFFLSLVSDGSVWINRYTPGSTIRMDYTSFMIGYPSIHKIQVANNKIYCFAGNTGEAVAIMEYMPTVSPWLSQYSPEYSNAYGGFVQLGNYFYSVGGYGCAYDSEWGISSDFHIFKTLSAQDLTHGYWIHLQDMPTARMKIAAAAAGGKLYVIGGDINNSGSATNKVEAYDPGTNTWTAKKAYPYALHSMTAVTYNDKIYDRESTVSSPDKNLCLCRRYATLRGLWCV